MIIGNFSCFQLILSQSYIYVFMYVLILVLDNGDIKTNEMQTQCSSGTYSSKEDKYLN